jgi:hypothetical protein
MLRYLLQLAVLLKLAKVGEPTSRVARDIFLLRVGEKV